MKYCFGVDIGGTKCAVVLAYEDINAVAQDLIIEKKQFDTNRQGPTPVIKKLFVIIDELIAKYKIDVPNDLVGIGISCGGPLDANTGVIMAPPNLPGWDNVPINKIFADKYNVKIQLENDANACAIAEWKFGAGKGCKNLIFLTFGTGLGAGLILNGAIYQGTNGMAGEVGHIRLSKQGPVGFGKAGSFEGFCSGAGIAQIAKMKIEEEYRNGRYPKWCPSADKLDGVNAKMVADAALMGDELAQDIYAISGRYLGKGLACLVDILNPEMIIIGSIFERNKELLWRYTYETLQEESLAESLSVCRILPSALGDSLGDYAAISVILRI